MTGQKILVKLTDAIAVSTARKMVFFHVIWVGEHGKNIRLKRKARVLKLLGAVKMLLHVN
jgi:hypothetical protein